MSAEFSFLGAAACVDLARWRPDGRMAEITWVRGFLVACPFFMPTQRLEGEWPFPHRLPLGAGWSGTCAAAPQMLQPSGEELNLCNVGYARRCDKLPAERVADAVRFALGEERDGLLKVRFALEREYLPAGHGELVYEVQARSWREQHSSACVQKMAQCYVESQLARRTGSTAASANASPVQELSD